MRKESIDQSLLSSPYSSPTERTNKVTAWSWLDNLGEHEEPKTENPYLVGSIRKVQDPS